MTHRPRFNLNFEMGLWLNLSLDCLILIYMKMSSVIHTNDLFPPAALIAQIQRPLYSQDLVGHSSLINTCWLSGYPTLRHVSASKCEQLTSASAIIAVNAEDQH